MKGQFFLISGVVVILALFLIKSSLNLSQIIENRRNLEVNMEGKEFLNIKNGLLRTVEYSYNKNLREKIINYINYVREKLGGKAVEFNGIFIGLSFRNATEGSENILNFTVYNFLGESIQSLNLTFDGTSQAFSNVADSSSVNGNFTFSSVNVNYTLILNYTTKTESKQYEIEIEVEGGKNKFIGFFDLRLIGLKCENRDEFSKVIEIA
jgi:hypothetical protein